MKKSLIVVVFAASAAIGMSCSGGGSTLPSGPAGALDVSGRWASSGQVVANTCAIPLNPVAAGNFTALQEGSSLTFVYDFQGLTATGTIDPEGGSYTVTLTNGEAIGIITASERGVFTSNGESTWEGTVKITENTGPCEIQTSGTSVRI